MITMSSNCAKIINTKSTECNMFNQKEINLIFCEIKLNGWE